MVHVEDFTGCFTVKTCAEDWHLPMGAVCRSQSTVFRNPKQYSSKKFNTCVQIVQAKPKFQPFWRQLHKYSQNVTAERPSSRDITHQGHGTPRISTVTPKFCNECGKFPSLPGKYPTNSPSETNLHTQQKKVPDSAHLSKKFGSFQIR